MTSSAAIAIGELAGRFGLATHVLRHWESVGLLAPDRGSDGRRRYRDADVYRVAVILQAKELGFGLDHIRDVLQGSDRPARHAVLEEHLDALERTIASAEAAKRAVEHALACPVGAPPVQAYRSGMAGSLLVRPRHGKWLAGVCAGIADRFGLSRSLVRIGFVLFGLFGVGEIVYIALWILVPKA